MENVGKNYHLRVEVRFILVRLVREIEFQLNRDIVGFECETRSLGNLLPLIYQAFVKIWCCKGLSLVCRKKSYTQTRYDDVQMISIPYSFFKTLEAAQRQLHAIRKSEDESLPF